MLFRKTSPKVFIVGRNKTGTTSLNEAFRKAGFCVGDQNIAEHLMVDWSQRNFHSLLRYCKTADVFQDVPFSLPYTYQALDHTFPGSRFILTMRDSSDQWYQSLIKFHTQLISKNRLPTAADLQAYSYVYPGWLWQQQQLVYGADETSLYNREKYIAHYEQHNADVQEYFRHRPKDLLVLNLSAADATEKLTTFLALPAGSIVIPHLNATST